MILEDLPKTGRSSKKELQKVKKSNTQTIVVK